MPAIKPKKSGGKPATKRKATRKKTKASQKVNYRQAIADRLGRAGMLALGAVGFVIVCVLWAGGYIGQFVEGTTKSVERQIAGGMVAAGFDIKDITIVGRKNTSVEAIGNALGPVLGTSMMHFDPYTARARIEEIGWVRAVSVSRLWPDRINISIREREPAAVWQVSGTLRLVDRDGAVIREIGTLEYSGLPHIVGIGAPETAARILGVVDQASVLRSRITSLVRASDRRWDLYIDGRTIVKLPEFGFEDAVRELSVLDETVGVLDHPFEYIDFRDPERVYFKCRSARLAPPGPNDRRGSITVSDLLDDNFSCPIAAKRAANG